MASVKQIAETYDITPAAVRMAVKAGKLPKSKDRYYGNGRDLNIDPAEAHKVWGKTHEWIGERYDLYIGCLFKEHHTDLPYDESWFFQLDEDEMEIIPEVWFETREEAFDAAITALKAKI